MFLSSFSLDTGEVVKFQEVGFTFQRRIKP
jgi:hypothetical protein